MTNETTSEFGDIRKRLNFLVTFAITDLATFEDGDWARLMRDLDDCVRHSRNREGWLESVPAGMRWCEIDSPKKMSVKRLKQTVKDLQQEIRRVFEDQADSDSGQLPVLYESKERGVRFFDSAPREGRPVALDVRYQPVVAPQKEMGIIVRGDMRSMVLYTVLHDMVEYPHKPIKRCKECQQIFYGYRKKQYCSTRCNKKMWNDQRPTAAERRQQDEELKRRLAAKQHGRQKK